MGTNKDSKIVSVVVVIFSVLFIYSLIAAGMYSNDRDVNYKYEYDYSDDVFSIITTPENQVLESTIVKYAEDKDFEVKITYADNLEIVDILNSGAKFDAIWASNSVWLDMLDSSVVKTSNLKSTSITPVVFGIKKSLAQELGLVDKNVTMNDLLVLIRNGKLKKTL